MRTFDIIWGRSEPLVLQACLGNLLLTVITNFYSGRNWVCWTLPHNFFLFNLLQLLSGWICGDHGGLCIILGVCSIFLFTAVGAFTLFYSLVTLLLKEHGLLMRLDFSSFVILLGSCGLKNSLMCKSRSYLITDSSPLFWNFCSPLFIEY